jgi:hypothetical protein
LEGRDQPAATQRQDPSTDEHEAAVFADALPNQQAPPISASAAMANNTMERSTVMPAP